MYPLLYFDVYTTPLHKEVGPWTISETARKLGREHLPHPKVVLFLLPESPLPVFYTPSTFQSVPVTLTTLEGTLTLEYRKYHVRSLYND